MSNPLKKKGGGSVLTRMLGWFFIAIGMLFVARPQILKNRMRKKSFRAARRYLFGASVFLGVLLITTASRYQGILPKIIMVAGVLAILKGFFLFKEKAADAIMDWFMRKPVILFRIGACFHIAIGIILLNLR